MSTFIVPIQSREGAMNRMKPVCLFIFVFLSTGIGVANAQQQAISLNLEKSVDLALQKNISVIQAQNAVDASNAASLAAVGGLFPSLNISAQAQQYQNWSPESGGTTLLPNGQVYSYKTGGYANSYSYSTGISSSLIVFDGFSNTANVKRARSSASASEYTLTRTQQSVVLQTHQLFQNVVSTYQLMKVNEDNLKRDQRQLERIVESNKVGAVAIADVYRQQVQVGTDELNLIKAQANHENAKADLVAFLGIDVNQQYSFDFAGIPTDIDTTEFVTLNAQYADYQRLVEDALAQRPDYQASIENLNSTDASVTMARASYFPTIRANGSYGLNSTVFNQLTDYKGLSLGLSVSLPIFNGFATQSQVQSAEAQQQNANEQVSQNQRQIRVDIRKALLDLEAAEKGVRVSQATVTSATMDRQIAEEKYNLGAGTLLDLLTATANYTTALSNKVSAVTGYLLAKKQVEFALGTISK
jgi:outer membrane protein